MKTSPKLLIKNAIMATAFSVLVAAPVMAVTSPVVSSVAAGCEDSFLGVPPWYRGLTNSDCSLRSPADFAVSDNSSTPEDESVDGLSVYIWKIVLNVVEMLLVAMAYITSGFIMYGAFIWLAGGARPDLVAKGRKTILNAVIGLIISIGAIAITNLIFGLLG